MKGFQEFTELEVFKLSERLADMVWEIVKLVNYLAFVGRKASKV